MSSELPDLATAALMVERFAGGDLTRRIANLETSFAGVQGLDSQALLLDHQLTYELLASANVLKRAAGQIHVVIHTIGILLCLPTLLDKDERIESLSLGAGNTGRAFDVETDRRIAEFKFINWQGGSETIRQNALFKDFFQLEDAASDKRKVMYVLDTKFPLKFLRGGRALNSVMSKQPRLLARFRARFGDRFQRVREYYAEHGPSVELVGIQGLLSRDIVYALADADDAARK
jgi:hypothetical protein